MAQFVDWDLAAATAAALGKSGPAVSYEEAAAAVTDLRALADEATEHVSSFTGLRTKVIAPPVRIVDRRDWAATNIEGLRQVIQPLAERLAGGKQPGPVASAIGSRFTGVQAGTVLAYLSGKVLGQYEVFSADPGQLLLVAPNIVEAERRLGADPRDFRLWVCLHEVTHRVQFTAVPWMRGYFLGEVGAFVDASQLNQDQLAERLRRGIGALADVVRDPNSKVSVLDLVQTPGQRAVLDRLTALMTVLEGHAEFVMDGVGPEVLPSVEEIRAKFNRRRESTANPLDRVLRKLLGVDVKMRQYAEGRKFVHAVVERVGMDGFNKIWQSPLTIPRLDELSDPDAWVVRVHGSSALTRPVVVPAAKTAVPAAPVAAPATAGVVQVPPAPVPTLPEPVESAPAEAGIAESTEVAGLSVEEATAPVTPATTTAEPTATTTAEPTATATTGPATATVAEPSVEPAVPAVVEPAAETFAAPAAETVVEPAAAGDATGAADTVEVERALGDAAGADAAGDVAEAEAAGDVAEAEAAGDVAEAEPAEVEPLVAKTDGGAAGDTDGGDAVDGTQEKPAKPDVTG